MFNYFARRELVRKLLTDAEIDVRKAVGTVKIVRTVTDSTLLGLNSKRRTFQRLTKALNIGC